MKLKYDFVINEIAGQKVAVAVGQNGTNSILKINDTGAYILELLKNDISVQEIFSAIEKDFEVEDKQQMEKSVLSFIEKLKDADFLE